MFDLPEYGGITLHVDIFHLIIRCFLIFDSTQNRYQFLLKEAACIHLVGEYDIEQPAQKC